jgi:hypothetical protein
MPNCDWGSSSSCSCSECKALRRTSCSKKCIRCDKEVLFYEDIYSSGIDGGSFTTYGYCEEHYINHLKEKEIAENEKEKERIKKDEARMSSMAEFIKSCDELPIKLVPIKIIDEDNLTYGCNPYFPDKLLYISKENGRWKCCENRITMYKNLDLKKHWSIYNPRK